MEEEIDIHKVSLHWVNTSDRDYETMIHLYNSKDYNWSLFIGHIVLERLLKAVIVKLSSKHAPFTHDLTKLAKYSKLPFSEEQLDWLDTITTFNLNARYDTYKEAFYKKCTQGFSSEWIDKITTLRTWIKNRL